MRCDAHWIKPVSNFSLNFYFRELDWIDPGFGELENWNTTTLTGISTTARNQWHFDQKSPRWFNWTNKLLSTYYHKAFPCSCKSNIYLMYISNKSQIFFAPSRSWIRFYPVVRQWSNQTKNDVVPFSSWNTSRWNMNIVYIVLI